MMFSRGTRTLLKRTTPFSIPRSPMNWQRCTTSTPGHELSTMKAVIPCRPLPSRAGVRAMTTSSSAIGPLVHQSFSPLRMNALPSSVGSAVALIRAGSLPTSGSVSANAVIAPRAIRGRYFFFCSSVPNSFRGWGTPID